MKKKIEKTVEGMLPEIGAKVYSGYKSISVIALILSAIPLITYFLL